MYIGRRVFLLSMVADVCSLTMGECTLCQLVAVASFLVVVIPFLSFGSCGGPGRTRFSLLHSRSFHPSHLMHLQQDCQGKGVTVYKVTIPIASKAFVS